MQTAGTIVKAILFRCRWPEHSKSRESCLRELKIYLHSAAILHNFNVNDLTFKISKQKQPQMFDGSEPEGTLKADKFTEIYVVP